MKVTARQKFEGLQPYQVIAGCSLGGVSPREMVAEIIDACVTLSSDSGTAERLYKELAETPDDDIDVDGWTTELEEIAEDSLPPYCALTWQDNELTVLPYLPDDIDIACIDAGQYYERPADIAHYEKYLYLEVNDHGNATLFQWNDAKQEFESVWSMV